VAQSSPGFDGSLNMVLRFPSGFMDAYTLEHCPSFVLHWGIKRRTTGPINERLQRSVHYNCSNRPSPPSIPFLQGGLTIFINIALLMNLPDAIMALELHCSFRDGKDAYL
jgi:hypothetical protein